MRKSAIVNLNSSKFLITVKQNYLVIIFSIVYVLGIIIGTFFSSKNSAINSAVANYFSEYLSSRHSVGFFKIFLTAFFDLLPFALAIFLTTDKSKTWPILLFPLSMAASRIYLMVHYFSDCLFAILVGSFASGLAYLITYLLFNKTKGKFNNFVNNFKIQDLFNKNKKSSINTDEQ